MEKDDNITEPQGTGTEPQGDVDWKSESRKWEDRAKANKERADANEAAAAELKKIKEESMSELERLTKRAEEAEGKLAAANAAVQHSKDVAEVSAESGVPASLLEYCTDRHAMEAFAKEYGAAGRRPRSASRAPAGRTASGGTPDPADDDKREFVRNLLGNND